MTDNKETWPWTRFVARKTDFYVFTATYYIIIYAILYLVARNWLINFLEKLSYASEMGLVDLLKIYSILLLVFLFSLILYAVTDSIICKKFGRNLGHKIFGLKIINPTDRILTFNDYLIRSLLVSVTLLLIAIPLFGLIVAVIAYINYKKTGNTYWDRLAGFSVTSENASNIRTIMCFSIEVNIYFIAIFFLLKTTYSPALSSQPVYTISPEQKAFIEDSNKVLPRRINELVIADKVNIKDGNVIIHYIIEKENKAPLTEEDNIHLGVMKLSSPKTAIDYLCSPKGRDIFTMGKEVVYTYTLQDKALFQYFITPSMCPQ